ncbi:hypothetical protein ACLOJK_031273 [Asimina triloba]
MLQGNKSTLVRFIPPVPKERTTAKFPASLGLDPNDLPNEPTIKQLGLGVRASARNIFSVLSMIAFAAGVSIATSATALPKLLHFSNLPSPSATSKQRPLNATLLYLQPSNLTRTFPSSTIRVAAATGEAADMASPSPSTTLASGSNPFAVLFKFYSLVVGFSDEVPYGLFVLGQQMNGLDETTKCPTCPFNAYFYYFISMDWVRWNLSACSVVLIFPFLSGNICRSPAAEGVFRSIVKQKGLLPNFTIDSAGTINYHEVKDE